MAKTSVLFDDRHADTRMRRLIVVYARAAVALTASTAPFIAPTWQRTLALWGACTVALIVAEVVDRSGLLVSCGHGMVFGILVAYAVLIALGSAAAGQVVVYGLLYLLPVMFSAIFFEGWRRFAMPLVAIAAECATAIPLGLLSARLVAVRLLLLELVAVFGAQVSEVLRESVRTHRALHAVLEAATGATTDQEELAAAGLSAALSVTGWEMGAVLLVDDDVLRMGAARNLPDEVSQAYRADPVPLDGGGMSADIVRTRQPRYVEDLRAAYGDDHVLPRCGVVSMAGTPISYHGDVIGVLITSQRSRRVPDDRQRDRLQLVAEQLGLALGNARAHAREARVVAELRSLNRRKDEFLSMVSHELRTPAAAVEMAAVTLEQHADRLSAAERAEVQGAIRRRIRDLRGLIETLLETAVADSGEQRVSLQLVQWPTAVRTWARTLGEQLGRDVVVNVDSDDFASLADGAKVERIVANLLGNAAKFSPVDSPIRLELERSATEVALTVRDGGIGIEPEDQERIFDRFFQVDGSDTRRVGGAGLGLALVQQFTALHGGTVTVDSVPGHGSAFTVRIPRRPLVPATREQMTLVGARH